MVFQLKVKHYGYDISMVSKSGSILRNLIRDQGFTLGVHDFSWWFSGSRFREMVFQIDVLEERIAMIRVSHA